MEAPWTIARASATPHAAQAPRARRSRSGRTTGDALDEHGGSFPANEDLLSGTGPSPAAAPRRLDARASVPNHAKNPTPSTASAPAAPRYVRQRTPHRSQGTVDDLNEESVPHANYTHDSNIAVGGATPLSGMAYRRSRSNMSRVKSGTRYGQYLEIPKGRRSIFASRERARRRRSVLALIAVIILLVFAGMLIWNMMQNVLS